MEEKSKFISQNNLLAVLEAVGEQDNDSLWLNLIKKIDFNPNPQYQNDNFEKKGLLGYLISIDHPSLYKMLNPQTANYFKNFVIQEIGTKDKINFKSIIQLTIEEANLNFLQHLVTHHVINTDPLQLVKIWENIYKNNAKLKNIQIEDLLNLTEKLTVMALDQLEHTSPDNLSETQTLLLTRLNKAKQFNTGSTLFENFLFYPQKEYFPVYVNAIMQNALHWHGADEFENNKNFINYFIKNSFYKPTHNSFEVFCENYYFEEAKTVSKSYQNKFKKDILEQSDRDFLIKQLQENTEKLLHYFPTIFLNNANHKKTNALNIILNQLLDYKDWDVVKDYFEELKIKKNSNYKLLNFLAAMNEISPNKIEMDEFLEEEIFRYCFLPNTYLKEFLNAKIPEKLENISKKWFLAFKNLSQTLWNPTHPIKDDIGLKVLENYTEMFPKICQHLIDNYFLILNHSVKNIPEAIEQLKKNIEEFEGAEDFHTTTISINQKKYAVYNKLYQVLLDKHLLTGLDNIKNNAKIMKL